MDLKHKDLEFKDQALKEVDLELKSLGLKNKKTKRLMQGRLYNIEMMEAHGETRIFYKVSKVKLIMSL